MPCPIPGCDKRITQQLLENDEIMADRVRRSKARDEQNASNTQFFDVE
jgi:SUMO ligase MMS21 Smc5/6 complex component